MLRHMPESLLIEQSQSGLGQFRTRAAEVTGTAMQQTVEIDGQSEDRRPAVSTEEGDGLAGLVEARCGQKSTSQQQHGVAGLGQIDVVAHDPGADSEGDGEVAGIEVFRDDAGDPQGRLPQEGARDRLQLD
jgi:hypothetical protein